MQAPDGEVAVVVIGDPRRLARVAMIRVAQVLDEVAAEPPQLGAQRREVLGPGAQVIEVDVPEVDPVGLLLADEAEAVPVGEQLLAEVVVGPEEELAERRLLVVDVGDDPGPVERGERAHVIDVLTRVDLPDQILGRIGVARIGQVFTGGRVGGGIGVARQVERLHVDLVAGLGEAAARHDGLVGADLGMLRGLEGAVGLLDQLVVLLDPRRLDPERRQQARREHVDLGVVRQEPVGEQVVVDRRRCAGSAGRCARPISAGPGGR